MKPLQIRLQEARKRLGLPWEILERDYLLSWVLTGIAQVESLRDTLVFKGGTALKKCYFGALKGFWSVTVSGNWRVIFRFEKSDAFDIDLVDYH